MLSINIKAIIIRWVKMIAYSTPKKKSNKKNKISNSNNGNKEIDCIKSIISNCQLIYVLTATKAVNDYHFDKLLMLIFLPC